MKWTKKGFEEFSKGTMGNSGQNLYVSAKGVLQRIFNFDVNGDGYPDIPIANSHSMNEKPYIHIYDELGQKEPLELPTNGSFDGLFVDLYDRGVQDLVVACQHNGVHSDVSAMIYFGSEIGLSEKYKMELRAPNSYGVVAGDFRGTGKKSLIFISGDKLRHFEQTTHGIEASKFTELEISAMSMAAGDLDGDGFDDLFVMHSGTGEIAVYWGDEDGINPERKTEIGEPVVIDDGRSKSTTAGRKSYRWIPWRTNVLKMNGKTVIFRADGRDAVFDSFDKDRNAIEELRIFTTDSESIEKYNVDVMFAGDGPMHATSGDLTGRGTTDVVVAVATDFEKEEDIIVLWEEDGYSIEKATRIPIRAARTLSIGKMNEDGKNYLFVCQACEENSLTIDTAVFSFDKNKNYMQECLINAQEPTAIISGKTYTDGRYQLAVINHEGNRHLGLENTYVYLGGEDGYVPERRLEFPGCASTDMFMVDFTDNGHPDVLVVNCAENAPTKSPGSTMYWNGEGGFDITKNFTHIPKAEEGHGAAIGDFRKSGYLDIAICGISSRDIKIFEGGPDGYDFENPKYLVMGPDPEGFVEKYKGLPYSYKLFHEKIAGIDDPGQRANLQSARWQFAADFNGDGWLDIFVSQIAGDRSVIFWGGPDGFSHHNYTEIATDGISAANAADLDGDGYLDLVCSCHLSKKHTYPQEYGKFVIYWGGPDGYQEHRKTQLPTHCCNALTINDFNGDGLLDIYGTAYNNGRCRDIDSKMYFQSEDRMFHADNFMDIFNHSGCGCMSGDFNGDGYIDLAVASHKAYGNHESMSYIFWGGEDGINEQRYTELPSIGPHGMCTVDIGNIMDRSNSEYYYSEAYKADSRAVKISWIAENGKKTWVKVQFRCADSIEALETAEWSESFENGADISAFNLKGFIQYKLELGAYCGTGTPRVTEVTVEFE